MTRALRDLQGSWRTLAATDLAYKSVAFALLTPAATLLLRWLRSGTSSAGVVADVDIFWFFVTTPAGVATLVLGSSLIVTITALEAACLMAIGVAAAEGTTLDVRSALAFGAANSRKVLGLTARIVVRVLVCRGAVRARRRSRVLDAAAGARHQLLPGGAADASS